MSDSRRIVDVVAMVAAVAMAAVVKGLDDSRDGGVVGGGAQLFVDVAGVEARRRRGVAELAGDVAAPRPAAVVAAGRQLERSRQGRRSVRTTHRAAPSLRLRRRLQRLNIIIVISSTDARREYGQKILKQNQQNQNKPLNSGNSPAVG